MTQQETEALAPLRLSVLVGRPPAHAFRVFTEGIGTWWPLETHSVGEGGAENVELESRVGGQIVETIKGGDEAVWGTILAFEPPHRLVFDWHPGYEPGAPKTEIEVRFTPEGEGTRVELEHRGWERLADRGPEARLSYEEGWAYVFGRLYAEAAATGDGT